MFEMNQETYYQVLMWLARLPVIFFALTVHEFAHAITAVRFGDLTPQNQGRVTLNPLAHLDPLGTLMILFGPVGWGKPVMINSGNFRHPRAEFFVSIAGPVSNIIQAALFALFMPFAEMLVSRLGGGMQLVAFVQMVAYFGVLINLALAFFNMIPLFPLDGEKVLVNLLPLQRAYRVMAFRPASTKILVGLFIVGFISGGLISPIGWWMQIFVMPLSKAFFALQSGIAQWLL
jgi:Zn-dependent protease